MKGSPKIGMQRTLRYHNSVLPHGRYGDDKERVLPQYALCIVGPLLHTVGPYGNGTLNPNAHQDSFFEKILVLFR
jgi:hypothetical protein